jgi:osmoprotectant transport system ATP-binding protein
VIRLEKISKSFNQSIAVHDLDMLIEPGKATILIGPSGCGKSTLIRLIVGLISSDSGQIFIEGEEFSRQNILNTRRKIGYVIQEGGLFPHLSARRNISLMARYLGWPQAKIDQRICDLAQLSKFPTEALDRFPVQLSGGQQQRVSLMRALMLDPPILLLDEPLGALDPMIRYELQEDLKHIFTSLHKTVLMVTHDLSEASYFADYIVLMNRGSIVQQGQVSDLFQKPADTFVTKFIQAQRAIHDSGETTSE